MLNLSAVIIAKNEEKNISRCLRSLDFVNEIVLLDTGSTDRTCEIARSLGAKVFTLDEWKGFGLAKRRATELASNDWIFSIDADEVASDELKQRIQKIIQNPEFFLYRIKRKSFYLGKMINYCGWQRDFPKRLFNRKHANFNDKPLHESVVGNCPIGTIYEPIYHYTYPTIKSHLQKIDFYTDIAAEQLTGKKYSFCKPFLGFIAKFCKMYLLERGFLDGRNGLILSFISAFGVALKYLKIIEKQSK
ncbi:MAG TPA: glycosyltransferase family 2 protein [Candidatus Kapabacteria bacterium]|nr:glycosyltransferase family 2 protein [Candidatus Kapabacteria bacterium]